MAFSKSFICFTASIFMTIACMPSWSFATDDLEQGCDQREATTWWAMARYVNLTTLGLKTFNGCDALPLTARQRRACRLDAENDYERMRIMARASLATVRECSRQFQDRRWNCSSFLANESQPLFGQHFIHTHSREAAFLHALMGASAAHEMAQACRTGKMRQCSCGSFDISQFRVTVVNKSASAVKMITRSPTVHPSARPSPGSSAEPMVGCSDNIDFGLKNTRGFMRRSSAAQTAVSTGNIEASTGQCRSYKRRSIMDAHNEEAGRQILLNHMTTKCKCVGISNACNVEICWREVPSFRKIGKLIMDRYKNATRMKADKTRSRLIRANALSRKPAKEDLVFIDPSPSFCASNPERGILGTQGRECHELADGSQHSCSVMCCGRGHKTVYDRVVTRCNCRFIFCCRVACSTCESVRRKNFCN